VSYEHRYRGDVAPPQQEKILRPPGYSLHVKLDDLIESILQTLAKTSLMFLIATLAGWSALIFVHAYTRGTAEALNYAIFFVALFTVSIIPGIALMRRAILKTTEARNSRLGLRGEQAVAEALYELGEAGYRVFHDLQPDGTWNIDHVVVGTRGVFVIETKARCRRPPKRDQAKHVVVYDGCSLLFPSGTDYAAIEQVQRNASWVADFLAKKTCEVVSVDPIVVIPGWYIESKGTFPVKVMNACYLKSFLRKQSVKIDAKQVLRIIAALDEKCRTLEF
jgi:hypothetical protein